MTKMYKFNQNHQISLYDFNQPIVRGKTAASTEFGAKMAPSLDENGMAQLEKCHTRHTTKAMFL